MKSAIDSVQLAPSGTNYATWQAAQGFNAGQEGATQDPDLDGSNNLQEFFAGTNPLDPSSIPFTNLTTSPTGFTYVYHQAKDRTGFTHNLQSGPLDNFANFTPTSQTASDISPEVEEVTVHLPPDFGPFLRHSFTLE